MIGQPGLGARIQNVFPTGNGILQWPAKQGMDAAAFDQAVAFNGVGQPMPLTLPGVGRLINAPALDRETRLQALLGEQ